MEKLGQEGWGTKNGWHISLPLCLKMERTSTYRNADENPINSRDCRYRRAHKCTTMAAKKAEGGLQHSCGGTGILGKGHFLSQQKPMEKTDIAFEIW